MNSCVSLAKWEETQHLGQFQFFMMNPVKDALIDVYAAVHSVLPGPVKQSIILLESVRNPWFDGRFFSRDRL